MVYFIYTCRKHHARAFTLTEMAIVLGVIGVMLGGIWAAAAAAHQSQQQAQAQKDLQVLVQNIRTLYTGRSSMSAEDFTAGFVSEKIFPADMISGMNAVDIFGDSVSVVSQSGYGGALKDPARFEIVFWNMSSKNCLNFINRTANSAATGNGLTWVYSDFVGGYGDGSPSLGAVSAINEASFSICAGNVVLQYTLQ